MCSQHDDHQCKVDDEKQGNYIMYASATSGELPNNVLFSKCSIINITLVRTPLGDKVSVSTHIYPHKAQRKIEVIICKITRLTAHFMCGLMPDLLISTCL